MPWKISYDEDRKIIRTDYTDPLSLEDFFQLIEENFSLAKEKGTNLFLADCTKLEQSGQTFDIYLLGSLLQSKNADIHIKEVVVVMQQKGQVVSDLQFFETVTNNRNINVHLFFDIESAILWLQE